MVANKDAYKRKKLNKNKNKIKRKVQIPVGTENLEKAKTRIINTLPRRLKMSIYVPSQNHRDKNLKLEIEATMENDI